MERVIHISQNIRFKETFGNTKKSELALQDMIIPISLRF
jgi:hypothetical protein